MKRSSVRISLAIAVAALSVPALTGCFANPIEGLVRGGIEQAIEGASGADISFGGALPDGWPAEVPVIDGEIVFGGGASESGSDVWMVTIVSNAADPVAEARAKLEAAGFTQEQNVSAAGGTVVTMTNGTFTVAIAGGEDGVLYTVNSTQ